MGWWLDDRWEGLGRVVFVHLFVVWVVGCLFVCMLIFVLFDCLSACLYMYSVMLCCPSVVHVCRLLVFSYC